MYKSNNNRTLIIGFSNYSKIHLMNDILLQKQEPTFIITKSVNQYPKFNFQTSDDFQTMGKSGNSTVVFDDTLLSK